MKRKSWKTTVCGILGLVALVAYIGIALLDGDPRTNVDLEVIAGALAVAFPSLGNVFSRDNDKSSEDVGAK